jgi:hypothetical protein
MIYEFEMEVNRMKTSKRVLAILMTAAMVLSFAIVPTFAVDQTLTVVTYLGPDHTGGGGDDVDASAKIQTVSFSAAATIFDAALGAAATIDIPVAYADLETFKANTTVTGTADTFIKKATPYTFNGTQDLAGIKLEGSTVVDATNPVEIGDYVLIAATGDTTSSLFVILHIVQAGSGSIEGIGSPEEVAYRVIVPLNVDFALDPGELNLEDVQIFGADYAVTNRTPNYAVNVKFDVTKKSDISTIANILPGTAFNAGNVKESKISVVNAASVTLNSGNTAFATASYDSTATSPVAKQLDIDRRTVAVGAAAAGSNASTAVSTIFELDKYGTTDTPATTLSTANVGAFTFRGELNKPDTLVYASGDVKLIAAYSFAGVGSEKYEKESPTLVGANAKPFALAGYGFVATSNAPADKIQNNMWLNPDNDNVYAGHTTLTYTAAQATAGSVYIGMDLPTGTTVNSIWFGEIGATAAEFSDQTALFDLTGSTAATRIKLNNAWSTSATGRTFEYYIVLSNGETWAVTVNANAA